VTPTPEAREREARLRHEMYVGMRDCPCRTEGYSCVKCDARIDRYAAAVRAALVAEIVAGVEGLKVTDPNYDRDVMAHNDALNEVLTYLHGLAPETDR
jgi:hypothetical protein